MKTPLRMLGNFSINLSIMHISAAYKLVASIPRAGRQFSLLQVTIC